MRKSILRWARGLVAVGIFYLLFAPVSIDPVAWTPTKAPAMAGPYAPNQRLKGVARIGEGFGIGPEDVALDAQGRIYAGYVDGRIVRFDKDGKNPKVFSTTGGRPLGLAFDGRGNLYVADAVRGLVVIAPNGKFGVLVTQAEGVKFRFTNDVVVAKDGMVYFTDSSARFGIEEPIADIFEHRGTGRLMAYNPADRSLKVLLRGLQYANGIAISPDQSFVLVVETASYRVRRFWLKGPKAGRDEIFIDNLPGFADNISSNGRGTFWLAMFTVRNPVADRLAGYPFVRRMIWRLPQALQPGPKRYSFVLGLDAAGKVTHNLQDPQGRFWPITSVEEAGGHLYLGSLTEPAIGRIKVR